jgi:hypothetical protein
MSLSTVTSSAISSVATTLPVSNPLSSLDTRSIDEWEKERSALYQQLDEKVINLVFT